MARKCNIVPISDQSFEVYWFNTAWDPTWTCASPDLFYKVDSPTWNLQTTGASSWRTLDERPGINEQPRSHIQKDTRDELGQ